MHSRNVVICLNNQNFRPQIPSIVPFKIAICNQVIVTKSFGGLLSLNDWDRSVCGSLGALLHSVCLCTTGLLATVGCSVGCCRRIRSKLLCTFYVHLATCKMGRKTRRNDSYIHSGKPKGKQERGTFYRTHQQHKGSTRPSQQTNEAIWIITSKTQQQPNYEWQQCLQVKTFA